MKKMKLFVFASALSGFAALLGSIAGAVVSHKGLFIGAIGGGIIGTYIGARLSQLLRLIEKGEVISTALGGSAGFVVAAALSVNNLHTPVIPIVSTGLIGLGSLAGLAFRRRNGGKKLEPYD